MKKKRHPSSYCILRGRTTTDKVGVPKKDNTQTRSMLLFLNKTPIFRRRKIPVTALGRLLRVG
jgi:hypothetical protein